MKTAFELSDLLRQNDTVTGPTCQQIYDLANANQAGLTDYGVVKEDVMALKTAIDAYTGLLTKPREAVVGRKEVTGSIAQDEDAADKLIKDELDPAMRKFKAKNAPFFNEYTSARMIIDLGERHEKAGTPTGGKLAPTGATGNAFGGQTQPAQT